MKTFRNKVTGMVVKQVVMEGNGEIKGKGGGVVDGRKDNNGK